jgi:uncharacterized damage-inducible protein DinB
MTDVRTTVAVAALARFSDSAFDGQHWHATMRNLATCTDDDWDWVPPEGERTIREVVRHIGKCKLMFANQLFGDGTLSWDDPEIAAPARAGGSVDEAIAWLRESHTVFRDGIAGCTDDQLATTPDGYWGKPTELQWSIEVMIQHEVYHAGEINHIRALRQGDDGWGNEPAAEDLA